MTVTLCPIEVTIVGFLIAMIGCFLGGYLASYGWHMRKREFMRQMMIDCTEEPDGERTSKATA